MKTLRVLLVVLASTLGTLATQDAVDISGEPGGGRVTRASAFKKHKLSGSTGPNNEPQDASSEARSTPVATKLNSQTMAAPARPSPVTTSNKKRTAAAPTTNPFERAKADFAAVATRRSKSRFVPLRITQAGGAPVQTTTRRSRALPSSRARDMHLSPSHRRLFHRFRLPSLRSQAHLPTDQVAPARRRPRAAGRRRCPDRRGPRGGLRPAENRER